MNERKQIKQKFQKWDDEADKSSHEVNESSDEFGFDTEDADKVAGVETSDADKEKDRKKKAFKKAQSHYVDAKSNQGDLIGQLDK